MSGPRIGELFAGYGGLGMGVQAALGGEMAWYSEIDKGALKILEHRFPDVPNIGDITVVDWSTVEPVDILTGGSPCQDLSHAGKRAGMTEGTRSNLWVAMREAIAQLQPRLVIWENVRGAASAQADSEVEPCPGCVGDGPGVHLRALGRVVGDLAELGYVGGVHGLRAADVGGAHGRFRFFAAATAGDSEVRRWHEPRLADGRGEPEGSTRGPSVNALRVLPTPSARDWKDYTIRREPHRPDDVDTLARALTEVPCALLPTPRVKNNENRQSEQFHGEGGNYYGLLKNPERWGDYAAAIARWERVLGRPAPAPTMTSAKGNPQLSPAFVEWLMGLPAGWVTGVPGITRNEALKALGNGVVPQQAEAAVRFLLSVIEVAA